MKSAKNLIPVCSLILAALIFGASVASACTAQCVTVAAPFCQRCMDTGEYTGSTCRNSGACICFYTLNNCGTLAFGVQAQPDLAAVTAPASKGPLCSAQTAEDPIPAMLLQ